MECGAGEAVTRGKMEGEWDEKVPGTWECEVGEEMGVRGQSIRVECVQVSCSNKKYIAYQLRFFG